MPSVSVWDTQRLLLYFPSKEDLAAWYAVDAPLSVPTAARAAPDCACAPAAVANGIGHQHSGRLCLTQASCALLRLSRLLRACAGIDAEGLPAELSAHHLAINSWQGLDDPHHPTQLHIKICLCVQALTQRGCSSIWTRTTG